MLSLSRPGVVVVEFEMEMMGYEARTLSGGSLGAGRVPALKLKQFNFTGATQ